MEQTFPGFRKPEKDYFRMPNGWTDITSEIDNLAELKIVEYVLRHTWGYQENQGLTKISTDEFVSGRKRADGSRIDKGTGLSDRSVKNGVALALEHGYIICEVDDHDRARIKKYYGLKEDTSDRNNVPTQLEVGRNNLPISDRKDIPSRREQFTHRSDKDNYQKQLNKNNNKERSAGYSPQPTKPVPVQSIFSLEEQQLLDWYEKLNTGHKTKTEKAKEILPDFLQHVHSFEDMQEEHDYTAKRLKEEGKADQTVYMATIRYYMLKRLKEKPTQPGLDMSEILLWTRYYDLLPNRETSADFWFLFEYMTRMEALNYGIANNGELFGKKLYAIEDQLKASDEATKRGLIEQWLAEKQGVQSLKIAG